MGAIVQSAYWANIMDVAPQHAGILLGISNFMESTSYNLQAEESEEGPVSESMKNSARSSNNLLAIKNRASGS